MVILVEPTALRDEEVDELGGVECDARGGATYQGDLAARPKPLACLGSGLGWGWDFFGLGWVGVEVRGLGLGLGGWGWG